MGKPMEAARPKPVWVVIPETAKFAPSGAQYRSKDHCRLREKKFFAQDFRAFDHGAGDNPRCPGTRSTQVGRTSLSMPQSITCIAPPLAAKTSIKARGVMRSMRALMCVYRVIALRVTEGFKGRYLHVVGSRCIVGLITAVADFGTNRSEGVFCVIDPRYRIKNRLGQLIVVSREPVDLIDIEDAVTLY